MIAYKMQYKIYTFYLMMTQLRHPVLQRYGFLLLGLFWWSAISAQPPVNKFYSIRDGLFEASGQWSSTNHNGASNGSNPGCVVNGNVDLFIKDSLITDCNPLLINGNADFEIVEGGKLVINGNLEIFGNADFDIADQASLIINGNLTVSGSGAMDLEGDLTVNGNVIVSGNGEVCGSGSASVTGSISGDGWCFGISTLPVSLVQFSADGGTKTGFVNLKWVTAAEINNDRFILERSDNGLVFYPISEIKGQGTSFGFNSYTIEDGPLEPGSYYYKLKQIDKDGTETSFEIISTRVEKTDQEEPCELEVNPNPCVPSCKAVLNCEGSVFKTFVIDGYGRTISELIPVSKFNGQSTYYINPDNFMMPGIYFIKASGEGKELTKKVMIK